MESYYVPVTVRAMEGQNEERPRRKSRFGLFRSSDSTTTSRKKLVKKGSQQNAALRQDVPPRSDSLPYSLRKASDAFEDYAAGSVASSKFGSMDKGAIDSAVASPQVIDKDTGERKDLTVMLHAMGYNKSNDSLVDPVRQVALEEEDNRPPGENDVASLSPELWDKIILYISPTDAANLAMSCRTLFSRLGDYPLDALRHSFNMQHRIDFLLPMDESLPDHLFCFVCASYHRRIQPGRETLKPANVLNPLFVCPNARNLARVPARTRLAVGRTLPFTFVQLALRTHRYGPRHGIPCESLSRRWKCPESDWNHQTRYMVHKNGHLLVRVVSQCFAPPELTAAGMRLLLFSREDYTPFFSVCAHWKDGDLMKSCKCALGHVPKFQATGAEKYANPEAVARTFVRQPPRQMAIMCSDCRPMRRCPECPTEYLLEVKLSEDKSDAFHTFKQTFVVTRWSDLGDGSSPATPEWASCNGLAEYDSFEMIGKRAISGIFESQFTDTIPGQRIISMNPTGAKKGEAGHDWY